MLRAVAVVILLTISPSLLGTASAYAQALTPKGCVQQGDMRGTFMFPIWYFMIVGDVYISPRADGKVDIVVRASGRNGMVETTATRGPKGEIDVTVPFMARQLRITGVIAPNGSWGSTLLLDMRKQKNKSKTIDKNNPPVTVTEVKLEQSAPMVAPFRTYRVPLSVNKKVESYYGDKVSTAESRVEGSLVVENLGGIVVLTVEVDGLRQSFRAPEFRWHTATFRDSSTEATTEFVINAHSITRQDLGGCQPSEVGLGGNIRLLFDASTCVLKGHTSASLDVWYRKELLPNRPNSRCGEWSESFRYDCDLQ